MPSFDSLFNAFVTILVTIDPPGLAPLFLAVTRGMNRDERQQVSVRASVIGFLVMALFAIAGASILSVFGITLPAFRVAGGFLLFFIAFEMVFERRQDRKEKIGDVAITKDMIHNIAAFPLAIPLLAGPGAITATILLAGQAAYRPAWLAVLLGVIVVAMAICVAALLMAARISKLLRRTGNVLLSRLLGVILAALAVQYVIDGARAAFGTG
jgi:multiple antibiotic resistance protein